jgi:hypothetical protein
MTDDKRATILELSTEVEPSFTIAIDGVDYELRTMSHLTKLEEAKLRRIVRKEIIQVEKINATSDDTLIERLATDLSNLRMELIEMMTTIPHDVLLKLPAMAQAKIAGMVGSESSELIEELEAKAKAEAEAAQE